MMQETHTDATGPQLNGPKIPIHNKSGPEKPDWAVTWHVKQISTGSLKQKTKGQQKGNTKHKR
jgi:hypothetical protein